MSPMPFQATSAYFSAVPGVGVLRFALAATQRVWPALAVRAAGRLFLTPLPPKWVHRSKRRGQDWGSGWRIERWPFDAASVTLYSRPSAGKVVLLVHGWGGHAGQLRALADNLAAQGMHPVIVDMPAHGRSAGMRATLPQFARVIDYVTARLGQQGSTVHALVAHSLGGAAAAYAVGRSLPVEKLVLIAPAASPPAYTRMFAQVFGLSELTRGAMQRRIEAREGMLMAHFEAGACGPRIGVPTLVVHDRGDSVNPFADGEAYLAAVPGATLIATEGLGHRAILKDAGVLDSVGHFLAAGSVPAHKKAAPSCEGAALLVTDD